MVFCVFHRCIADNRFREIRLFQGFIRFGGDLLSHVLRRSTIGATALNGRVRNGSGCFARAMTTKPNKALKFFSSINVVQVFSLDVYAFDLFRKCQG